MGQIISLLIEISVMNRIRYIFPGRIVLFTITFALVTLFLACNNNRPSDNNNITMESEINYLALGDSYTIGESVVESDRWPVQLADRLRKEGVNIGTPEIIARTGWTTDELQNGISERKPSGTYGLVSLLIGVNNQYRGRDSESFRGEFQDLLNRAISFAANDTSGIFVLSIPDWGVMHFAEGRDREKISAEIDEYNNVCREECEEYGITFFDITPISREAVSRPEFIAVDGLHPSGAMYAEWVEMISGRVKFILADN